MERSTYLPAETVCLCVWIYWQLPVAGLMVVGWKILTYHPALMNNLKPETNERTREHPRGRLSEVFLMQVSPTVAVLAENTI